MRLLHAIAAVTLLLALVAGAVAPHHHDARGGHDACVACTVGGALEARDATPVLSPPAARPVAARTFLAADPVTGAPLGSVPGQSPPLA